MKEFYLEFLNKQILRVRSNRRGVFQKFAHCEGSHEISEKEPVFYLLPLDSQIQSCTEGVRRCSPYKSEKKNFKFARSVHFSGGSMEKKKHGKREVELL